MLANRQLLQLTVGALLAVSVVMIRSAGMTIGAESHRSTAWLLWMGRDAGYAVLAIGALAIGTQLSVRRLRCRRDWTNPLPWLMVLSLGLCTLALAPGMGRSVNGASRWLFLGPRSWGLSFQPSELAKWVMVAGIASWCARRGGVMHRFWHGLAPALALIAGVCGLIVIEDLGTAVLIAVVGGCLLAAGGARWWQLCLLAPLAIAAAIAAMIHSPYRLKRLAMFLDPWVDPLGSGYHPIQSMLTIAQGGLIGRGLGNGIQKFGYLPEDTTDFIFAIVCEELGLAGAGLVIGLFAVLIWTGWAILRDCRDPFGRLFTLGVLLTIGIQTVINLAVVTVLAPTKGIALPLVSKGGTGWVLTAFFLGLVCGLDRENQTDNLVSNPVRRPTPAPSDDDGPLIDARGRPVILATLD